MHAASHMPQTVLVGVKGAPYTMPNAFMTPAATSVVWAPGVHFKTAAIIWGFGQHGCFPIVNVVSAYS